MKARDGRERKNMRQKDDKGERRREKMETRRKKED